jgi:hypothetical protein
VRDYRTHLVTVAKRAPRTINTALAAIDDFYTRRGLGPASAGRLDLPAQAPRALDAKTALRWVRATATHPSPRGRVLATYLVRDSRTTGIRPVCMFHRDAGYGGCRWLSTLRHAARTHRDSIKPSAPCSIRASMG